MHPHRGRGGRSSWEVECRHRCDRALTHPNRPGPACLPQHAASPRRDPPPNGGPRLRPRPYARDEPSPSRTRSRPIASIGCRPWWPVSSRPGASAPGTAAFGPGTAASAPGTAAFGPGAAASAPGIGATAPGTAAASETDAAAPGTGSAAPGTAAPAPPGDLTTAPGCSAPGARGRAFVWACWCGRGLRQRPAASRGDSGRSVGWRPGRAQRPAQWWLMHACPASPLHQEPCVGPDA
jgi:hypothetical protein